MKTLTTIVFIISLTTAAFAVWTPWAQIPNGTIVGEPQVVVTKDGQIHVMGRGTDNALWWTRSKDGGKTWFGNKTAEQWSKVGGTLTSAPSCMEPIPNVVECYVRNSEKGVSQIDRINEAWGPWAGIGGIIMTNISATAYNQDTRMLRVVNTNGRIAGNMWDGINSTKPGWIGWQNWPDTVGKTSWIKCSDLGGNSQIDFDGDVDIQRWYEVCVINLPGGPFSLIKHLNWGSQDIELNFAKASSAYPAHVKLHSLATAMDLFFVDKDKQMKHATYNFKTGWVNSFQTIANGQFSSGPSCDYNLKKVKANTICVGRGTDGAVWYSFRPTPDALGNYDPGNVQTGKVLFNAGNAQNINEMWKRPSAGEGMTLKIKTSDAVKCSSVSCDVNLGVLLVRQKPSGASAVSVLMTGSNTLPNGDKVVYANQPAKFADGVKTISATVRVNLAIGKTTPVIVRVVKANGEFLDPDAFDAFLINVALEK